MSQERTTLEVIAPTPEEAIDNGLQQLGLSREAVEVEVLDTGSKGLFGLGGRQARVRLTVTDGSSVPAPEVRMTDTEAAPIPEPVTKPPAKPKARKASVPKAVEQIESTPESTSSPNPVPVSPITEDDVLHIARQVAGDLLERMHVRARVSAHYTEPEDDKDESVVMVEVQGDDLSILIGRRSETLNAFQYITTLIVAREVGHWIPVMIDVQGYRSRRERQLRQLAHRMAEQAVSSGRRQVLEPMPPNERRVIHLELRESLDVTTESIGDEPNRKVTIIPKQ